MVNNHDIIQYESDFDGSKLKDLMTDSIPFADGITSMHSMIMLICACLCICFLIGRCIIFGCYNSKHISNLSLLDELSYEQLMKEYIETKNEMKSIKNEKSKLMQKLTEKIKVIGKEIKKYLIKNKKPGAEILNPEELSDELLQSFFEEHKVSLSKSLIKGLHTYRLTVNLLLN